MNVIEPIVLQGHVISKLRELPDESVHCVVTSPPYYGLRSYSTEPQVWGGSRTCSHEFQDDGFCHLPNPEFDYSNELECGGWRGELGLEPTPDLYVQHIVEVFREIRRVLRTDGTCWANWGDSYAANGVSGLSVKGDTSTLGGSANVGHTAQRKTVPPGLKPKDLCMIPARVALALQADGWWLRSDIIWEKPGVMPESVTDRPTKSHEYVFLLAKSKEYFYDQEAIKEESSGRPSGNVERVASKQPNGRSHVASRVPWDGQGGRNKRSVWKPEMSPEWFYLGVLEYLEQWLGEDEFTRFVDDFKDAASQADDVWSINTQPFPGAHFAVWPEALVEPMIKAGTSEKGCCPSCRAPWKRIVEKSVGTSKDCPKTQAAHESRGGTGKPSGTVGKSGGGRTDGHVATLGWEPSCKCGIPETVPCTVLDPFGGSGTTALVATRLGRKSILIELRPEYAEMARQRTAQLGMAF